MGTTLGRLGLLAFVAFGIFVVVNPDRMPRLDEPYDKFLHVGVFGLATFFAVRASRDYRMALSLAGLIMIAGILVELFQSMLPGRSADLADAAANAVGSATVLALFFWLRRNPGESPDDLVNRQVLDAYNGAKAGGQSPAKCLEAAATAYRLARPTLAEHEIRLQVVKLIEEKVAV